MKKYISLTLIYCLMSVAVVGVSAQTKTPKEQLSLQKVFSESQSERTNILLGKKLLIGDVTELSEKDTRAQNVKSDGFNKKIGIGIAAGVTAAIIIIILAKRNSDNSFRPGNDPICITPACL
jgi:hypothetical protein